MLFKTSIAALLAVASANELLYSRDLPPAIAANADSYTNCANAAWPPSKVGGEIIPQRPSRELREMLNEVNAKNIERNIRKLVSFGSRHTLSEASSNSTWGIGAARDWMYSEFQKYARRSGGRLTPEIQTYEQGIASRIPFPTNISNVLATIKGSEDNGRVYVITGHYDTRVTDVLNYKDEQPGANDDASGTALVMELARVLSTRTPKSTFIFAAVAGEEQGLYGAQYLAQTLKNSSQNVEAMLNNDVVGSALGDRGQKDPFTIRCFAQGIPPNETPAQVARRLQIGGENDSPARQLARFATEVGANDATGMDIAIIYRLDRFLRGGDHTPFLEAGFPAVRFTEPNEIFEHQHQDLRTENGTVYGDLVKFVDFAYTARVGRVNLATLWSLSEAPGLVRNVTIDTTILDNDTRLKWLLSEDPEVKSYEVVWRATTAPLWTHYVDVGRVSNARIELSKDNVIFGVRAVGRNGMKSPVTYPFPG